MVMRVLLQDKSSSLEALDSVRDLVKFELEPFIDTDELTIDITRCLSHTDCPIDQYQLIISHPHTAEADNCCVPHICALHEKKIPVILTYKEYSNTDKINAIAQDLTLEIRLTAFGERRHVYAECIKAYLFPDTHKRAGQ